MQDNRKGGCKITHQALPAIPFEKGEGGRIFR